MPARGADDCPSSRSESGSPTAARADVLRVRRTCYSQHPAEPASGRPPALIAASGVDPALSATLFQRESPQELLSQILAARGALTVLATPLGTALGGPLTAWLGAQHTLLAYSPAGTGQVKARTTPAVANPGTHTPQLAGFPRPSGLCSVSGLFAELVRYSAWVSGCGRLDPPARGGR